MNLGSTLWDTNLAAAIVGGIVGSAITWILTANHDRYKGELDEHHRYLHLMNALLNEIDYIHFCLNEFLEPLNNAQRGQIAVITKRLNADFLQTARLLLATISSSSEIFPGVTRAFRDVEHCNGMLDRYENECKKEDTPSFPMRERLFQSGLLGSTTSSLRSTIDSLAEVRARIEESKKRISESRPRLFLWRRMGSNSVTMIS
jgi:hypothetical protein